MNVQPYIKADKIREIARLAHCHIYTEHDCIVYGNEKFLALFAIEEYNGKVIFRGDKSVRSYFSGCSVNGEKTNLTLKKNGYEIYIFE